MREHENHYDATYINHNQRDNAMRKTQTWEKIVGFSFGVVFVIVMIALNVIIPNPTSTQYETFKVVLALAAAGIGGILAGFIHVEGTFNKIAIRAGGALALFLVIYLAHPGRPISQVQIHQTLNGNGTIIGKVDSGSVINIIPKVNDSGNK